MKQHHFKKTLPQKLTENEHKQDDERNRSGPPVFVFTSSLLDDLISSGFPENIPDDPGGKLYTVYIIYILYIMPHYCGVGVLNTCSVLMLIPHHNHSN